MRGLLLLYLTPACTTNIYGVFSDPLVQRGEFAPLVSNSYLTRFVPSVISLRHDPCCVSYNVGRYITLSYFNMPLKIGIVLFVQWGSVISHLVTIVLNI